MENRKNIGKWRIMKIENLVLKNGNRKKVKIVKYQIGKMKDQKTEKYKTENVNKNPEI